MSKKDIYEAKKRLDKLISKSRDQFYKPIQIAEILYQDRVESSVSWDDINTLRRQSTRWRNDMLVGLGRQPAVLNSRYEDQLFDSAVLPPAELKILAHENRRGSGVVELYIYNQLLRRRRLVMDVREWLSNNESVNFSIHEFLAFFEHEGLKRNTDKAYEIAVYALFDVLVRRLEAQVSLSIPENNTELLKEFEDFAMLVLGLDTEKMSISQPARLYRVGATNAADAGLDMWANFGPAVQVKHMILDLDQVGDIVGGLSAEHIVIVCRDTEESVIDAVMRQTGVSGRIRGFVVHSDLVRWYSICCTEEHADGLGKELVHDLLAQYDIEFRTNEIERVKEMFIERDYPSKHHIEMWPTE